MAIEIKELVVRAVLQPSITGTTDDGQRQVESEHPRGFQVENAVLAVQRALERSRER